MSERQAFKRIPVVAASRSEMAEIYRKTRADDPAIARLLYRRVRDAQAAYNERFFQMMDGARESSGGLAALIEDDLPPNN